MTTAFYEVLGIFVEWVQKSMLPLWRQQAIYQPQGWVLNHPADNPNNHSPIELSAQAQMIYVLARAEQKGWLTGNQTLIKKMSDFAGRHGTLPCRSDGYIGCLDRQLNIIDPRHYLVDHANFMMSSAATSIAYGCRADNQRARNIFDWLALRMAHPQGGWYANSDCPQGHESRPHLHMLLALLTKQELAQKFAKKPNDICLVAAKSVADLFQTHFFNTQTLRVQGYYAEDWTELTSDQPVAIGEQFLWIYALNRYVRMGGDFKIPSDYYHSLFDAEIQIKNGLLTNSEGKYLSTSTLVASILSGLMLVPSGDLRAQLNVTNQLNAFLDNCLNVSTPGAFFDMPGDPLQSGSINTMWLLFEVAQEADFLLSCKNISDKLMSAATQ
jgi:mannose/cellobiose epimerase-like protein (N-acyl-D-glucosamine 2-epimerase family)